MSLAWETTTEDLKTVLDAHGVSNSETELEDWLDEHIDTDLIEENLLYYTDMEIQTDSMLSDIEDQLMETGVIPKNDKKFTVND